MIVHIDPKEASQIRHSIIGDAVFTLVQDTVTKLNHEHLVSLSPIEVFASAQELYEALTGSEGWGGGNRVSRRGPAAGVLRG